LVCIENCSEDNLIINIEKQTERQGILYRLTSYTGVTVWNTTVYTCI